MSDGWHKEMSLHYHISAVADFYETIRLTKANNLTNKLDPDFNEHLRKAAEVLTHFTYPNYFKSGPDNDYIVPGFNDSWKSNWKRSTISKTSIDMLSSSQTAKNSNIWQQPSMATLLKEAIPTLK